MWGCWKRTSSMIGLLLSERRLPHGHTFQIHLIQVFSSEVLPYFLPYPWGQGLWENHRSGVSCLPVCVYVFEGCTLPRPQEGIWGG